MRDEVLDVRFGGYMVAEVHQKFWEAMARGEFITDAVQGAGSYRKQGARWLVACGGVRPRRGRNLKGRCLTFAEREEIALLRSQRQGVRQIAAAVGRSPSTISRELRRNAERRGGYRASTAHAAAYERASRPKEAKLVTHQRLRERVESDLDEKYSPEQIAALLRTVRPSGAVEHARKAVAKDLVAEIRSLDQQLRANAEAIAELVATTQSSLAETVGVGPILAGRLISRTGRASRFPTSSAFANYAGVAPIEIASAEKSRHRLSRHGDRQLNSVLHTIAITQIRMPSNRGHLYYRNKIEQGKTPREATRCVKRRLADHL